MEKKKHGHGAPTEDISGFLHNVKSQHDQQIDCYKEIGEMPPKKWKRANMIKN